MRKLPPLGQLRPAFYGEIQLPGRCRGVDAEDVARLTRERELGRLVTGRRDEAWPYGAARCISATVCDLALINIAAPSDSSAPSPPDRRGRVDGGGADKKRERLSGSPTTLPLPRE